MQKLDFESLNEAFNGLGWCNTFAYWLLVLNDSQNVYAQKAQKACAAMSFQYDAEDQALNMKMLIGDAELIPAVFVPIAPVTLSLGWSPFPAATEALGRPLHVDAKNGEALAFFRPFAQQSTSGTTPDEQHFHFLLQHVCNRASQSDSLVLLVGSPGWDYYSTDFIADRPELPGMMREFGFIYTLRKPLIT